MEILTDWQTDRPTDIVVHREVILPKISIYKRTCRKGVNLLKWFTLWDTATRYSGYRHKSYSIISFHFLNHFSKKKKDLFRQFVYTTNPCMYEYWFFTYFIYYMYIFFSRIKEKCGHLGLSSFFSGVLFLNGMSTKTLTPPPPFVLLLFVVVRFKYTYKTKSRKQYWTDKFRRFNHI